MAGSGTLTAPSADSAVPFWQALLAEQQSTTAVDDFAAVHDRGDIEPLLKKHYRDLIPLTRPKPGEQYAFEVDLDACSGCKSCVTSCHNLNGLEEGEQWRSVGMLHGGTQLAPYLQHVTWACHHCVEPACLAGCPVLAYEKDPLTGIVRHLDDQCIGCQYCIFTCPYEVPYYSPSKGIVRKCDMCHDRLAAGEAPACVQACPNSAIRINTVSQEAILSESESQQFLPSAPEPGITLPTTVYRSNRPLPRNALPADYYSARRQQSHLALVFMLVLTQLSVGAFVVGQALVSGPWGDPVMQTTIRPAHGLAGLIAGVVGMTAAVLHLGRPQFAFRALLGLGSSWLSREILAFAVFAPLALLHALAVWIATDRAEWIGVADWLGTSAAASGVVGVAFSVLIYASTHRPYWNAPRTAGLFALSSLVLGIPVALVVSLTACSWSSELAAHTIMRDYGQALCRWLMIAVAAKLLLEASIFTQLWQRRLTPLKRTAMLLAGELSMTAMLRFFFGAMGGLLLPLVLLSDRSTAGAGGYDSLFLIITVALLAGLLVVGELVERYLFFVASVAPRMPGGQGT